MAGPPGAPGAGGAKGSAVAGGDPGPGSAGASPGLGPGAPAWPGPSPAGVGAGSLGAALGGTGVALGTVGVDLGGPAPLAGAAAGGAALEGLEADGAVSEPERRAGAGLAWGGDAVVGTGIAAVEAVGAESAAGLGAATALMGFRARREIANSGSRVAAPKTPMGSGEGVRRGRTTAIWRGWRCGLAARCADLTGRPSLPDIPLGPVCGPPCRPPRRRRDPGGSDPCRGCDRVDRAPPDPRDDTCRG